MICTDDYSGDGNWKERILVMPAVAVGNVGQLAVDLLLSTLEVKHVGYLYNRSVLPVIGADPFNPNSKKLVTNWQVYDCPTKNLVIVQQRSPITSKSRKEYQEFLINWIRKHQFKMTVLLSSTFSQFFTRDELEGVPIHYLCTRKVDPAIENTLKELSWQKFCLRSGDDSSNLLDIPGGGVTEYLFEDCDENGIALVVMILACSEGNNYPEAFHTADQLNRWLKLKEKKQSEMENTWKIPFSFGLPFGNGPPSNLY